MKLEDYEIESDDIDLKITDLENFFDVNIDRKGNLVYNLNESVYLSVNKNSLKTFTCTHLMHWPLISYSIYGSTRLAWMLMKLNDVKTENVFDPIFAGESVYYIDKLDVDTIINYINI